MNLQINRNELLQPMQTIIGAVEKRQTMPALSNLLLETNESGFSLTATDLEITLKAEIAYPVEENGRATVPARKLLDICKALPEDASISLDLGDNKGSIKAGRSRFTLACLPADEFPSLEDITASKVFRLPQRILKKLIDKTAFAMANQDVRYYLNGLMLEVGKDQLVAVATDGHRLSLAQAVCEIDTESSQQVILPRKGVGELQRLLDDSEEEIEIHIGVNHLRVIKGSISLTSKLIDGRFPDYKRVVPQDSQNKLATDRQALKTALSRASILSNEKFRGVRLELSDGLLKIQAHNSEQEEAQEEMEVDYKGISMEVGFNVQYILDVLNSLSGNLVEIDLRDANSSALIIDPQNLDAKYVIMPMRI